MIDVRITIEGNRLAGSLYNLLALISRLSLRSASRLDSVDIEAFAHGWARKQYEANDGSKPQ